MAKLTQSEIRDYIFSDYLIDIDDHTGSSIVLEKMNMLIDNELATKIEGSCYIGYEQSFDIINVACKEAIKADKKLKKKLMKFNADEDDGTDEDRYAETNPEVFKLSRTVLRPGIYYVKLKKKMYMIISISAAETGRGNVTSSNVINFTIYIIGKKSVSFSNSLYSTLAKYKKMRKETGDQIITYSDGTPSVYTRFKSFDQVVMNDKQKVIDYIDHWVDNIPVYYNEYKMTPKLSILLYGEPGTGKSTFYRSVADYLKIEEVCVVNPSHFMNKVNDNSSEGLSRYNRRRGGGISNTMIAIDDIDTVCQSREKNESMENTSIVSNLLAFLDNPPTFYFKAKDGVKYPVSMVIATTNYLEKLDDAVKRYGRFDLKIEMTRFNYNMASEMCAIYGLTVEDVVGEKVNKKTFDISPSELQAKCMENIDKGLKNK